jgi:glycosyltransferase cpsIVJ
MSKEINNREEVSVVVPVYNRERIVADTLDSIKGQTYRPLHLILVDNNSSDSSLDVLNTWKAGNEEDGFKVTVVSELTPGAAAARNRGLREVSTDKLIFFDSDDIMGKEMIECGMETFAKHPDAMFVYWRHERECLGGGVRRSHFTTADKMECHLVHALLNTPSYLVRTDYVKEIGGWDENVRVWDDFELGVRMLLPSVKSVGIDEVLYTVKSREESITGTEFTSRAGQWEKVLDKIERNIATSDAVDKERMLRIVDYRRIILAAHYAKEGSTKLSEELKTSVFSKKLKISIFSEKLKTSALSEERKKGALAGDRLSRFQKLLLEFAYTYTSHGGRGAWLLLRHFF